MEILSKQNDDPEFVELYQRELASSSQNLHKRIVDRADSAVLVWFSSNTKQNLRGSVMLYEVMGREVNSWYAGFEKALHK